MKACDDHIRQTLKLTEEMLRLADAGDAYREDVGCGILYGVLRDSAFKIQKLAVVERDAHIRKGWWQTSSADVIVDTDPGKEESKNVAVAEKQHEKRYRDLAVNIEAGRVFKRSKPVRWRCRNCGFIVEAKETPQVCPACAHPQAHFELLGENW